VAMLWNDPRALMTGQLQHGEISDALMKVALEQSPR
jgi:hypothetical protein